MMLHPRGLVYLIDDEEDILKVICRRLTDAGYEVAAFDNPYDGLLKASERVPDLILLDIMMPHIDGIELKKKLNEDMILSQIPVIFLSAKDSIPSKVMGLQLGAVDYVTKPFQIDELLARIHSAIERKRHYDQIAMTDAMTGLSNQRVYQLQLELFFNLAKRYGHSFSLAVFDLNHLKKINDLYGHAAGDDAIKIVAQTMREVFRNADIMVRYGGDEFIVLMPETSKNKAQEAVERFRAELRKKRTRTGERADDVELFVSAGIAEFEPSMKQASEVFERADKELYAEKQGQKKNLQEGTVLIIEDESDIAKTIAFRLKKAGFLVMHSEDGEKGLLDARRHRPALIILDLMLPGLTGEAICKEIREHEDEVFARTPIIMLSAKTGLADQIVGRTIGANIYMCKPFDVNQLLENVFKLTGQTPKITKNTDLTDKSV